MDDNYTEYEVRVREATPDPLPQDWDPSIHFYFDIPIHEAHIKEFESLEGKIVNGLEIRAITECDIIDLEDSQDPAEILHILFERGLSELIEDFIKFMNVPRSVYKQALLKRIK